MALREAVEGEALPQVSAEDLDGGEELLPIPDHKPLGLFLGAPMRHRGAMQGLLHLFLPLLGHPGQHVPGAVDDAPLSGHFGPHVGDGSQNVSLAVLSLT